MSDTDILVEGIFWIVVVVIAGIPLLIAAYAIGAQDRNRKKIRPTNVID